ALTIDACPPHLLVRNPNYAEITGIIKSLAATPKSWRNGEGKILKFRARLPVKVQEEAETDDQEQKDERRGSQQEEQAEEAETEPEQSQEEQPRNLPVLAEPAPDAKSVDMIDAALHWVETATRSLLKIWSGNKEETAGFALSWESIERWLGELIRIVDA